MRLIGSVFFLIAFLSSSLNAQKLNNKQDSISYAIGVEKAKEMKSQGFTDLDQKMLIAGMTDVFNKKEPLMDPLTSVVIYKEELRNNKEKVIELQKAEGAEYLAEVAKRPSAKALPEGLYYEILTKGDGPKPMPGSDVTIHYEGRTIYGDVFDSSFERGTPNTFNLKRLIKGWQIALPEMEVGSKWRIYIPYDQAYGERGAGDKIKPYATLVFDIELISI